MGSWGDGLGDLSMWSNMWSKGSGFAAIGPSWEERSEAWRAPAGTAAPWPIVANAATFAIRASSNLSKEAIPGLSHKGKSTRCEPVAHRVSVSG